MQFDKSRKIRLLLLPVVGVAFLFAAVQQTFAGSVPGASIVGWGSQAVGVDLDSGFTAVATGAYRSLGVKAVCDFDLAGDVNRDCRVNFSDFAITAANWLIDCDQTPENPACVPK